MRWAFASPRAWAVTALLWLVYGTLYLVVAKALVVDPAADFGRFGHLPSLTLTRLSPHILLSWIDPAFVLYASDVVVLAPSVPAILTVLLLGALVGVNGAVAVETLVRRPPACRTSHPWWAVAALPSFLASFSCCAPAALLLLGAGAAGALVSLIPFVVPVAGLLLLASLVWSARRLEREAVLAAG